MDGCESIRLRLDIAPREKLFEVRFRRSSSKDQSVILFALGDSCGVTNGTKSKHVGRGQTLKGQIVGRVRRRDARAPNGQRDKETGDGS
jgi:hypothetical protein